MKLPIQSTKLTGASGVRVTFARPAVLRFAAPVPA
jgi:hypothetical protein